ncbi:prepilin peptidase CpaA [Rhodobacteraceae bacterium MBR-64]|jgi:prepilin peptidase CpaA
MVHMDPIAALLLLPPVAAISLWVAWSDMKFMRIPNLSVLALIGVFLIIGPLVLPLGDWLWRWVHLIVVLVIGFGLSTARLIGAGDAKFSAAMAPFIALGDLQEFLFLLAATMIGAFVTHRAARRLPAVRRAAPDWESWERKKDFPMGLALGTALILYLAMAAARGI